MIELKKYLPEDVIPREDLLTWRNGLKKVIKKDCPVEVEQFISAMADKLPDFGQIGKFNTFITGYELKLSGIKEFNGEKISNWDTYPMPVPHMVAVDHHTAMHRIFNRKGKQGLIDYCTARVTDTELERVLKILNVYVFKEESEEFKKVMAEIKKAT